jgi:hypothetical protein
MPGPYRVRNWLSRISLRQMGDTELESVTSAV